MKIDTKGLRELLAFREERRSVHEAAATSVIIADKVPALLDALAEAVALLREAEAAILTWSGPRVVEWRHQVSALLARLDDAGQKENGT